jgi:hypothetical protein
MSWIREWGSTAEERSRVYPCDRCLPGDNAVLFRAVDVAAPPALLFAWLCQLRAAPYSYDWLDNFGRTSPRRRDPTLAELAVGQRVMRIFELVDFERDRQLTLLLRRSRFLGEIAVTYAVARNACGARLVVKLRVAQRRGSLLHGLFALGDLIMMRKQLLTLKALAETEAHPELPTGAGRAPTIA